MMAYIPVAVGSLACLVCLFRHAVNPARVFPKTKGRYQTFGVWRGRAPGGLRVQCIYPAADGGAVAGAATGDAGAEEHCYFPARARAGLSKGMTQGNALGYLLNVLFAGRSITALDTMDAKPVDETHTLPVVVFSHGLFGNSWIYTQLCREIASWGAVVVAVNHEDGTSTDDVDRIPYLRPPATLYYGDRSQVQAFRKPCFAQRDADLTALFAFLRGARGKADSPAVLRQLNLDEVVLSGHSFGAASTLVHSTGGHTHLSNVKAIMLYDVWAYPVPTPHTRVPYPTLSILSGQFAHNGEAPCAADLMEHAAPPHAKASYYIPHTGHQLWSDFTFLIPEALQRMVRRPDTSEQYAAWVEATHAFLDRHVRGKADAAPASPLLKEFPFW